VTSVAVVPNGKFAYVANFFRGQVTGFTIDPLTGALPGIAGSPFDVGSGPISLVVASPKPSFRAVYIINEGSKTVSVLNPSTTTVVSTITVGLNPDESGTKRPVRALRKRSFGTRVLP
jgi:YVTN family beta-propeller protein